MGAPKKAVEKVRTGRIGNAEIPAEIKYRKHGAPQTDWFPASASFGAAWRTGKFSGDGQACLVFTLMEIQHQRDKDLPYVSISLTGLAELTGLSVASVQAVGREIATRCGNADPAWVRVHGKCAKDKCTCPKMLSAGKQGNINAYRVHLENFEIAPRYVSPPLREVKREAAAAVASEAPVRIAPGKSWRVPFSPVEQGVKEWEFLNEDDLPLAFTVTRVAHKCTTRIKRAAEAEINLVHQGEKKANANAGARTAGNQAFDSISVILAQLPITHTSSIIVKKTDDLAAALETLRAEEWADADFSPALVAKIAASLGETPVANLVRLANAELADPDKRHRSGPLKGHTTHPPKRLIAFANQASRAWAKGAAARAAIETATQAAMPSEAELAEVERAERRTREECPACLGAGGKCRACAGSGRREKGRGAV